MILTAYTLLHTLISLIGIVTGLAVAGAMVKGRPRDGWTAWFLWTTVLTSVTGFFFPVHHFMPSHAVGILSLIVLSVAIFARYRGRLKGHWRTAYVITAMIALYFNVFVLVVQSFAKVPALKAPAPTQTEGPFKLAQGLVLLGFVGWTIAAVFGFKQNSDTDMTGTLKLA